MPEEFIRRRSILIDEAIERSDNVSLESQNLCTTTRAHTADHRTGLYELYSDLLILEMLAKGVDFHLDFLNVIRPAYAVEAEMAWDAPE